MDRPNAGYGIAYCLILNFSLFLFPVSRLIKRQALPEFSVQLIIGQGAGRSRWNHAQLSASLRPQRIRQLSFLLRHTEDYL